jgi:type IV secretory pathway TrbD component
MKKLVLLFASFLLSVNVAFAKGGASVETVTTLSPFQAELTETVKTKTPAGDEKGKQSLKLTTAQKLALKALSKPLKKASLKEKSQLSGGMRTAIIVMAVGLILMILGLVFWLIGIVGFILFLVGLVLLLLELLG